MTDIEKHEEAPAKRYRLLARAQMHGAVQEPGYVFTLRPGEKGPMRPVVVSAHGANHAGHAGEMREEPLYEPAPPEAQEPEEDLDEWDGDPSPFSDESDESDLIVD